MLTLSSGVAAHELQVIRRTFLACFQGVAQNGGWLGSGLPFGYRRQGHGKLG